MKAIADHAKKRRFYGLPKYLPPQNYANARADRIKGRFIQESTKTVFGGPGKIARDADPGMPPGWSYIERKTLGKGAAWVKMHLLPERIGGLAMGNNLVPARGPETNGEFYREIEDPAYKDIPKKHRIIWYEASAEFGHPPHPEPEFADFPSRISAAYGGYKKVKGTGEEHDDWEELTSPIGTKSEPVEPPGVDEGGILSINKAGHDTIENLLNVTRSLADHLIKVRDMHGGFDDASEVSDYMNEYRQTLRAHNAMPLETLTAMLNELATLDAAEKVNWKKKGAS
jgi:hypothetical protein